MAVKIQDYDVGEALSTCLPVNPLRSLTAGPQTEPALGSEDPSWDCPCSESAAEAGEVQRWHPKTSVTLEGWHTHPSTPGPPLGSRLAPCSPIPLSLEGVLPS